MTEAQRLLEKIAAKGETKFSFDTIPCGGRYFLEHGRDWPEGAEDRCKAADLILLGAVGWPDPNGPGPVTMPDGKMAGYSAVIGNRTKLDLYANMRPVKGVDLLLKAAVELMNLPDFYLLIVGDIRDLRIPPWPPIRGSPSAYE